MRRRIGLVLDHVGAHGRGVLAGVARYAHSHGPWNLRMEPLWHFSPPSDFRKWDVDGYIAYVVDDDAARTFKSLGKPVVNVSARVPSTPFPSVLADSGRMGEKVADYFLGRNFRHAAFMGFADTYFSNVRGKAFLERMRAAGVQVHCHGVDDAFLPPGETSSRLSIRDFLRSLPKPVALMACLDVYALELIRWAQEHGLSVPEDVAIVGVGNDELYNRLSSPPLSSLATDDEEQGYRAAGLLDAILSGKRAGKDPIFIEPREVVTRQSSDVLAIDDPELSHAVRYIRQNAEANISVQDVLDEVAISRRPLEKRFRDKLKRTILREIHHAKVTRAKELLQNHSLSVEQVAQRCGFRNATRLGIVFRKIAGRTPQEYRRNITR